MKVFLVLDQLGGARLPNGSMILTKPPVCPTQRLATPIRSPSRGFGCAGLKLADPRLGTRIGLAQRWDSPTSAPPLILSGRPGASTRLIEHEHEHDFEAV
jgi:hypothetical protein